jgi:hypothetical protein
MAECMGLHRDGEAYGLNPLETHVRRLVWHQLCFLDIRTCEAQGPKPAIRREDYDTKLPLNCEEDQLSMHATLQVEAAETWTTTLLCLVRFEINEMMRIIWSDRRKLETRKTTLTAVLSKIENFRKRMFDKYNHFLDDRVPIQRYTKLVMHLLMYRLHAMVLHPYHSNTTSPMPARLNSVLIMAGIYIIEISMQLEANAPFKDWAWYLGAYQQYQIALLLATELYYRPLNKDADRIWRCLDHVFNLDPQAHPELKSTQILTEIMTKTGVYMSMRKMRAPTTISKAVPDKQAVKTGGNPARSPTATPAGPQYSNPHSHLQPQGGHHHATPAMSPHQPQQMGMPADLKPKPSKQHASAMHGMAMMPPQAVPAGLAVSMSMGRGQGPPPMRGPPPQPVMPNVVFAGVSNGEALWSLPPPNPDSPENSSDGGSVSGHQGHHHSQPVGPGGVAVSMNPTGNVLDNIDWVGFISSASDRAGYCTSQS